MLGRITPERWPDEPEYAFIIPCVTNAKNSLYPSIYIIHLFNQEHGQFTLKENPEPEGARTVSSQDLMVLQNIGLEKIKQWAREGRLPQHDMFGTILLFWRDWEGAKAVQQYITDNFSSDEFVIALIKGFINSTRSQSFRDHAVIKKQVFDLQAFTTIFPDVQAVQTRVNELLNEKEWQNDIAKAFNVFLNALDGKHSA